MSIGPDFIRRCLQCGWMFVSKSNCPSCQHTKHEIYAKGVIGAFTKVETGVKVETPVLPPCPLCFNANSAALGKLPDGSQPERYLHCRLCGAVWERSDAMAQPTLEERVKRLETNMDILCSGDEVRGLGQACASDVERG